MSDGGLCSEKRPAQASVCAGILTHSEEKFESELSDLIYGSDTGSAQSGPYMIQEGKK